MGSVATACGVVSFLLLLVSISVIVLARGGVFNSAVAEWKNPDRVAHAYARRGLVQELIRPREPLKLIAEPAVDREAALLAVTYMMHFGRPVAVTNVGEKGGEGPTGCQLASNALRKLANNEVVVLLAADGCDLDVAVREIGGSHPLVGVLYAREMPDENGVERLMCAGVLYHDGKPVHLEQSKEGLTCPQVIYNFGKAVQRYDDLYASIGLNNMTTYDWLIIILFVTSAITLLLLFGCIMYDNHATNELVKQRQMNASAYLKETKQKMRATRKLRKHVEKKNQKLIRVIGIDNVHGSSVSRRSRRSRRSGRSSRSHSQTRSRSHSQTRSHASTTYEE